MYLQFRNNYYDGYLLRLYVSGSFRTSGGVHKQNIQNIQNESNKSNKSKELRGL
jgi:hypothetical protein